MSVLRRTPIPALVIAWVLLIPTLFFVARGTFSFDHVNTNNRLDYEAGTVTGTGYESTYYRMEQVVIYGIVCFAIGSFLSATLETICRRRMRLLFLLPLWAVLSVVWSQSPLKTVVSIVPMCVLTCFGVYLTQRFDSDQQIRFFLFIGSITLISSLYLIYFYPSAGVAQFDGNGAWQGLFVHKNHCAIVMTYLLIPAFCYKATTPLGRIAIFTYGAGCLGLIAMTQSRTGWLLAALSLGFLATVKLLRKMARRERAMALLGMLIAALLAAVFVISNFSQLSLLLGKTSTMTGRTDIWKAIWPVLFKRPFIGFGYRAFWLGLHGESAGLELATGYIGLANAENAVLQIWLELGMVGTVLMFLALFRACKDSLYCLTHKPSSHVIWYSSMVYLTALALVDGDKIMFPHTIEWVFFVIAFVSLTEEKMKIQAELVTDSFTGTARSCQSAPALSVG